MLASTALPTKIVKSPNTRTSQGTVLACPPIPQLPLYLPNLPEIISKVGATAVKLRATTKGMVNLEDHSHASKTEGRLESRRKKTGTKRNIVTLTTLELSPPQ